MSLPFFYISDPVTFRDEDDAVADGAAFPAVTTDSVQRHLEKEERKRQEGIEPGSVKEAFPRSLT